MKVLAVINQEGGVGKTTACANLGAALARKGLRVLLVDLDPQAHLAISVDLVNEAAATEIYTLLGGRHGLVDVVRSTSTEGLFIAPTNLDLSGAETEFSAEIGRETLLRDAFDDWKSTGGEADVVLMDCPPSLGLLSLNALVAANHVLLPVQAEFYALQGMAHLLDVMDRVRRRLNPPLDVVGVLVGLYSKQRRLSHEVLDELDRHFGNLVLHPFVRVNVRLAEAPSHAQTIFEYSPRSGAAEDFSALAGLLATRLGLAEAPAETEGLLETDVPAQVEVPTRVEASLEAEFSVEVAPLVQAVPAPEISAHETVREASEWGAAWARAVGTALNEN